MHDEAATIADAIHHEVAKHTPDWTMIGVWSRRLSYLAQQLS